jgi:topoisomerase-4 subunit A
VRKKADGLSWIDSAGRTVTLSWSDLKEWVVARAQSGRLVPKLFPRSISISPAL